MKKLTKRLLTAVLALAMLVTVIPVVDAQAATTNEKVTMYVGESFSYSAYGNGITSVSSSKKSVVKVSKDKKYNYQANFTAKKAGTATLTIKYKNYSNKVNTVKIKVTVKKRDLTVTMKEMSGGYVLLAIKNNTKQTFDDAIISYTLKTPDGEVLISDTTYAYDLGAGKTVYDTVSYNDYTYTIDIDQCSAKVTAVRRSPNYTYKDLSSKLTVDVSEETSSDSEILTIKTKNTSSTTMSGDIYVLLYDANDNVVGMRSVSVYLKGKAVDTDTVTIYYNLYDGYDHYEIKKFAYSKTYKD